MSRAASRFRGSLCVPCCSLCPQHGTAACEPGARTPGGGGSSVPASRIGRLEPSWEVLSTHRRHFPNTSPSCLPCPLLPGTFWIPDPGSSQPLSLPSGHGAISPVLSFLFSLLHPCLLFPAFPPQNRLLFLSLLCHFSGTFLESSRSSGRPSPGRPVTARPHPAGGKGPPPPAARAGSALLRDSGSVPAVPHLDAPAGRRERLNGETDVRGVAQSLVPSGSAQILRPLLSPLIWSSLDSLSAVSNSCNKLFVNLPAW